MAVLSFNKAMEYPTYMCIESPKKEKYNGYYCDPKIDRKTLPEGWNAYDFRSDDDGCGIFVQLNHNYVFVNNAGTFFMKGSIPELSNPGDSVSIKIDKEEWKLCHEGECEDIEDNDEDWDYDYCDPVYYVEDREITKALVIIDKDKYDKSINNIN